MLISSSNNQIKGNRIHGALYGIALFKSSENTIDTNNFSENDDNAVLMDSNDNVIKHNNFFQKQRQAHDNGTNSWEGNYWNDYLGIDNNGDGFGDSPYFIFGTSTTVDATPKMTLYSDQSIPVPSLVPNEFRETPWQGQWIREDTVWENCTKQLKGWLVIESGATLTIRNCILSAAPLSEGVDNYILVKSGGALYVDKSTISGDKSNSYFKLRTEKGASLVILDSKVYYAGDWGGNSGIQLFGDGAIIENTEIVGNYTGMNIKGSSGHRLVNNKISDCVDGILVEGPSHDNTIKNNMISGCFYSGICISETTKSQVVSNRIENALLGLGLWGTENLVRGNQIQNSSMGLAVWGSDNVFYHNNFLGNGAFSPSFGCGQGQASDPLGGNHWDYQGEGNYWSDYIGNDADGNGIGDTPYVVPSNGIDHYPLMVPHENVFSDVPSGYWAYDYIVAIYNHGITKGCAQDDPNTAENERRYCPEENVTRGQMEAFIIRAKYGETFYYSTTPYFTDVPSTHTFFKYVQKLRDDGITVVSGTYGVDTYVTRGQMAAFIIRAKFGENFSYTTAPYFSDVPATHNFFKYVQKLKDEGITAVSGTYGVDDIVTRAQMAAFLARAFLGME